MIKRCDICNIEFETTNPNKKYCSPECGKQGAKIRDAKRRNADIVKDCPICGKRFEIKKNGALTEYCSQDCSDEARRIRNRERMRKVNPPKPDVVKECAWCGKEFTVSARNAHIARFCSDECNSRSKGHIPLEEYKTLLEEQKEETTERKERQLLIKKIYQLLKKEINIREKETEEQNRIDLLTRGCVECGEMFYNPSPNVLTCSPECSRKRSRRISRTIYKGRINDNNLVDKNITITKLYKRDKGICYICGKHCDWNDKVITDEGHTIVGESYPTIEHVIPLSKGGKHSWNNIKLACMKCNTLKGDKIIDIKDERAIV